MKPVHIFLFLIAVAIVLLSVAFIFPKDGIEITPELTLEFPTLEDIFAEDSTDDEGIDEILFAMQRYTDSLAVVERAVFVADSIKKSKMEIQYPGNDRSVLYPFFEELDQLQTSRSSIRIMHYGDSQIEGDRMTSYIRSRLQEEFGGSGPGLVPVLQVAPSFSIRQSTSDNWQKFIVYCRQDRQLDHSRYGALSNFAQFTPLQSSGGIADSNYHEGWIMLNQSKIAYSKSREYYNLKLFYGFNSEPVEVKFFTDGAIVSADTLPPSSRLSVKKWSFKRTPEEIMMFFRGKSSPEIYGMSLEGRSGIMMDNIGMRGSAGTIFSKIDRNLLKQMYGKLNVKLLILQFGGNAVPFIDDEAEAVRYAESFQYQMDLLRKLVPGVSIIVIGPADMSIKEKGKYVTHPQLENVRKELRRVTFDAGWPYFDIYEIMGGKNSMPKWVSADPQLASPDYIHFNPRGAKKVAELFYNSLINDYRNYQAQRLKKEEEIDLIEEPDLTAAAKVVSPEENWDKGK